SAKCVSSSESEGTARFGISLSRGKGKSGRITKPASGFSCNIARGFSKFASAKGAGWSGSKGASRFAISGSGGERKPGRGSAVACADEWRTTDVLRYLASSTSLFAAQYQRRLEHAVVSFSLSNTPHQ